MAEVVEHFASAGLLDEKVREQWPAKQTQTISDPGAIAGRD
jgi:hypothetical protein